MGKRISAQSASRLEDLDEDQELDSKRATEADILAAVNRAPGVFQIGRGRMRTDTGDLRRGSVQSVMTDASQAELSILAGDINWGIKRLSREADILSAVRRATAPDLTHQRKKIFHRTAPDLSMGRGPAIDADLTQDDDADAMSYGAFTSVTSHATTVRSPGAISNPASAAPSSVAPSSAAPESYYADIWDDDNEASEPQSVAKAEPKAAPPPPPTGTLTLADSKRGSQRKVTIGTVETAESSPPTASFLNS